MRHVRRAGEDGVRTDVDYAPVPVLSHQIRPSPAHQIKPVEIDTHDAPPFLEIEIVPFYEWHDGCRVHLNIELSGSVNDVFVQTRNLLGVADITSYGEGFAAAGLRSACSALCVLIDSDHGCA